MEEVSPIAASSDRKWANLHRDTNDTVCGVPEADVSGVRAAGRGPPWHGDDVDLQEDKEDHQNVPRPELGTILANSLATVSNSVKTDGKAQVENAFWVSPQTDD